MQDVIRRVYGKGGGKKCSQSHARDGGKRNLLPLPRAPPSLVKYSISPSSSSPPSSLPPLHKSLFHFRMHSSGGVELGRGDACLRRRSVSFWSDVHSARGRGQNFFPPAEKPCWVTHTHTNLLVFFSVRSFFLADEKQPCKPVGRTRAPFYLLFFGPSPRAGRARVKVMQHCFSPPKKSLTK